MVSLTDPQIIQSAKFLITCFWTYLIQEQFEGMGNMTPQITHVLILEILEHSLPFPWSLPMNSEI